MIKFIALGLYMLALGACVETSDEQFMQRIAAIGPNSPPTEVIVKRYPAINATEVAVIFGFPDDCRHLDDVGIMTGWGNKQQTQQQIMQGFRTRAAKYGANMVVFEAGVSSLEEMDELLRQPTSYSMLRCR